MDDILATASFIGISILAICVALYLAYKGVEYLETPSEEERALELKLKQECVQKYDTLWAECIASGSSDCLDDIYEFKCKGK